MLSIGKLDADRVEYYLRCLAEGEDEYYLSAGERQGYWLGSAASRLGLHGNVEKDDFVAVLNGFDPATGTGLVRQAGSDGRVHGFDLTFSAPKSVSVAWAFGDPETAKIISDAHDRAVAHALGVFETEVLRARRGHGGLRQVETEGIAAAAFTHRTSRAGDPQVHTHVVVANLTVDAEGHWSAPDGRRIYGWAKTVGYLYEAELRNQLTEQLGVSWGPVRKGIADIEGIDPALLERFSKRRKQIEAELERVDQHSANAARVATLATRPAKQPAPSLAALRQQWIHEAADLDLQAPDMTALTGRPAPARPDPAALVQELVSADGLTRDQSAFDRRHVLQAVAAAHPQGASTDAVRAAADMVLADETVAATATVTPVAGRSWTTTELLAVEARILDAPGRRAGQNLAVVPVTTLEHVLAERPSLSEEQRAMIARLTLPGDGIDIVVGRAGAGKTFALDAARAAWQASGHRVIGTALAARAAAELESDAGIPSSTIARLLIDTERPDPNAALPPGTVLVVDEAGMVGSRTLARILDVAERDRAKVVLVGDPRQLPEIESGGAFAALAATDTAVELVENRRQSAEWERAALAELRSGSVAKAISAYQGAGRVHVAPSADAARDAVVDDWWQARQEGQDAAMYALRRSDVDDLNRRARLRMRAAGLLGDETVTAAGRELAAGDRVLMLRNDRRLQARNGTVATITDLDPDTGAITATAGDKTWTLPGEYLAAGHVTHGYATTIHKGQGATVDRAFLLGSEQLYREAGYVGLSRARFGSDLYMVDADGVYRHNGVDIPLDPMVELAGRLGVSKAQVLALDHLHPQSP